MKSGAAIISVGDELLAGRVVDLNAHWLSSLLRSNGFPVTFRATVEDDVGAIAAAITDARSRADVVVVGGGLGPTRDDLTREGLALAMGVTLGRDPAAVAFLEDIYARRNRPMPEGSLVQADLPLGTKMVANPVGTAPAILLDDAKGLLIVLPGVPSEFRVIAETELIPRIRARAARGPAPAARQVTIAGVPEVRVGQLVADLMARGRDPQIGSYPKLGRVVLALESRDPDGARASRKLDDDVAEIRRRLGDAVVADGDVPMNVCVGELLLKRNITLALAESITGGMIADALVEVPGISQIFKAGFVTYANEAKVDLLGVMPETLATSGAVSEACVRAMAEGARTRGRADLALSVSGIAGPSGGSDAKPVGTTWFALADARGTVAIRHGFVGDRQAIRLYARERALDLIRRHVLGLPLVPTVAG